MTRVRERRTTAPAASSATPSTSASRPSPADPSPPAGTPLGLACRPLMTWTASARVFGSALPHAYTIVLVPSARVTSAGPRATVVVPASTTSALILPVSSVALASLGLTRPGNATVPLARTSTAGAAATWRTVSFALPAGMVSVEFTNGVRAGLPSAVRWATTVMLAPAGTMTPLASTTAVASSPAPAWTTLRSYEPAGSCTGSVSVPGAKLVSNGLPLAQTSTVAPGTPCRTDTVAVSAAWAGDAPTMPIVSSSAATAPPSFLMSCPLAGQPLTSAPSSSAQVVEVAADADFSEFVPGGLPG